MLKSFVYTAIVLLWGIQAMSQEKEIVPDTLQKQYVILEGDSVVREAIDLEEVMVFSRMKFDSKEERALYYWLRRKALKVFPYAKLASEP